MMRGRYAVELIGLESGNIMPVDFVRFRSRRLAEDWCRVANSDSDNLTRWRVTEPQRGSRTSLWRRLWRRSG